MAYYLTEAYYKTNLLIPIFGKVHPSEKPLSDLPKTQSARRGRGVLIE